jgi:hypothetical protein
MGLLEESAEAVNTGRGKISFVVFMVQKGDHLITPTGAAPPPPLARTKCAETCHGAALYTRKKVQKNAHFFEKELHFVSWGSK